MGSIDVGKDADLVIWSGHPFSTYSRAETTFVDGEVAFDRQKDLAARQERVLEKKERLKKDEEEAKIRKAASAAKEPVRE